VAERKIIHIDADCFYAAVEMREDPSLQGKPVAVGGNERQRGVVATCNYEARSWGVHSAMPMAQALKLCPDLIVIRPKMDMYRQVSREIHAILQDYSDIIEPLSLDEAFLDVTASENCHGSATLMAQEIRSRVWQELRLVVSAGVAPNKFLAKIASDWRKPNGLLVITPAEVDEFVLQLPVDRIHGVGKVTAQKLHSMGIETCEQLQNVDELTLAQEFGSLGLRLYQLSRGHDTRPVKSEWSRQSVSVEHTYPEDLPSLERCLGELPSLLQKLHSRLRRLDSDYRVVKAFVKVKFRDFTTTTLERAGTGVNLDDYVQLCTEAYERRAEPVRLLGLGVRLVDLRQQRTQRQLELFDC